jgi:hypothetical protein
MNVVDDEVEGGRSRPCYVESVSSSTVEPRFTNAPVHEQFGSRTNFPIKNVSDGVQCFGLRTRKLATVVLDLVIFIGFVYEFVYKVL